VAFPARRLQEKIRAKFGKAKAKGDLQAVNSPLPPNTFLCQTFKGQGSKSVGDERACRGLVRAGKGNRQILDTERKADVGRP
jgi:hypothetical protein